METQKLIVVVMVLVIAAGCSGSVDRMVTMTAQPTARPLLTPLPQSTQTGAAFSPAVQAAIRLVEQAAGFPPPALVWVVEMVETDWPDACLGVQQRGQMCAQVITPGYKIILTDGARRYEVHTDLSGKSARLVGEVTPKGDLPPGGIPPPTPGDLILTWQRRGGFAGFCDILEITLDGRAQAKSCRFEPPRVYETTLLPADALKQMLEWKARFKKIEYNYKDPAVVDAMSLSLALYGSGQNSASEDDIQAIQNFAAHIYQLASQGK